LLHLTRANAEKPYAGDTKVILFCQINCETFLTFDNIQYSIVKIVLGWFDQGSLV
jgi:hypothetical protein